MSDSLLSLRNPIGLRPQLRWQDVRKWYNSLAIHCCTSHTISYLIIRIIDGCGGKCGQCHGTCYDDSWCLDNAAAAIGPNRPFLDIYGRVEVTLGVSPDINPPRNVGYSSAVYTAFPRGLKLSRPANLSLPCCGGFPSTASYQGFLAVVDISSSSKRFLSS